MLPLSHDEVAHGKRSLFDKIPGDYWQKTAGLKLLLGYMWAHPGKKLLFMGAEFGQEREWNHDRSLDWHLLEDIAHVEIQSWMRDLNNFYKNEPALHEVDFSFNGFEWVDVNNFEESVISFIRKGRDPEKSSVLVVCNFTPVPRYSYLVGLPFGGMWKEVLNSDAREYGGSGHGNLGGFEANAVECHGKPYSMQLTLPPLGILIFKHIASK
jgi:1,4-alpha-glucan branching enzyme